MEDIKKEDIKNAILGAKPESLLDAIVGDIVGVIPIVNIFSEGAKLLDALQKQHSSVVLRFADLVTSIIPLSDLFTPTDTLVYLLEKNGSIFEEDKKEEVTCSYDVIKKCCKLEEE